MADAAIITVDINTALEAEVRRLSDALEAEKIRFGAMNAACKVALARIAELEAAIKRVLDGVDMVSDLWASLAPKEST